MNKFKEVGLIFWLLTYSARDYWAYLIITLQKL
jgi:hypothetical protein